MSWFPPCLYNSNPTLRSFLIKSLCFIIPPYDFIIRTKYTLVNFELHIFQDLSTKIHPIFLQNVFLVAFRLSKMNLHFSRTRKHKIPTYIQSLIDQLPPDQEYLVPLSGHQLYKRWVKLLKRNNLPHMTFHDLRHVNASIMALLQMPDKYAMERGGWKTDSIHHCCNRHYYKYRNHVLG